MSNYSKLYWFTRLDSVNTTIGIFLFLSLITMAVWTLCYTVTVAEDLDDKKEFLNKFGYIRNIMLPIFLVCLLLNIFMPSQKDLVLIWAGGKTMDFVQKDSSINKIPGQTTKIITDYLDKTIKELKKDKE